MDFEHCLALPNAVENEPIEDRPCDISARLPNAACQSERNRWLNTTIVPHEAALRRWLVRRAAPDEVSDVIHTCYMKLLALPSVAHIRNGKDYLFQIARRIIASQARRSRIVAIDYIGDTALIDQADDAPSADIMAESRALLDQVKIVLEAMPPRRRQVLLLRRLEEYSLRETAEALGLSQSCVEKNLACATQQLRVAREQWEEAR
jgi:RNA polymerase sigma factor (sigma-70 family)